MEMREMIEAATPKERKQFRAIVNHKLGSKLRKKQVEGQRKEELHIGDEDDYRND